MKPWEAPLYGGMSEASARKSYEAWVKQGSKPLPVLTPPATDEEIALIRSSIDIQLAEYQTAIVAGVCWYRAWKLRKPAGFRQKTQFLESA